MKPIATSNDSIIDPTCKYRHSCGMDYCMLGIECPDYEEVKIGDKYYGTDIERKK